MRCGFPVEARYLLTPGTRQKVKKEARVGKPGFRRKLQHLITRTAIYTLVTCKAGARFSDIVGYPQPDYSAQYHQRNNLPGPHKFMR